MPDLVNYVNRCIIMLIGLAVNPFFECGLIQGFVISFIFAHCVFTR